MNGRSCIDTGRGPPVEDWSGPGWHYFAKQVVNALIEVELGSYRRRPLDGFEARPSARPTGETRSGRFVAASARSAALPGRASDPAVAPLPSTAPRRLPSRRAPRAPRPGRTPRREALDAARRSEEHTSELQSRPHLVCRLLLEKKKKKTKQKNNKKTKTKTKKINNKKTKR